MPQALVRRREACLAVIAARREAHLSPMRLRELMKLDLRELLGLYRQAAGKRTRGV